MALSVRSLNPDASKAVSYIMDRLNIHDEIPLRHLPGHLSQAEQEVRLAAGRNPEEIRQFLQRYPDIFLITRADDVCLVEYAASGAGVAFLKETLYKTGPLPVCNLHGYLSQTTSNIREAVGRNVTGLEVFIRKFPQDFRIEDGIVHCIGGEGNDSDEESTIWDNESTTSDDESQAVSYIMDRLNIRDEIPLRHLPGHLSQAEQEVRLAAGRNPEEIRQFLQRYPDIFLITRADDVCLVEYAASGAGVAFLKETLYKTGPLPVCNLHGYLSQTTSNIREAVGRNVTGLEVFIRNFPQDFRIEDGIVHCIGGEGNESNEESTTSHSLHEENQKKQKLTKKQNVSTECPGGVVAQRPSESAEVRALRFAALLLRSCDLGIQNIVHAVHQVGSKEVANRFYTNEEKARELFMKHNSIFDVGTSCVCLRDVVRKGDVKRVDDNRGGIIRDQEGLGDVYFHNTSVYIPKKADVTNELDYQIKKKECVNYIAVESTSVMKKVEGSPFSQWRAILVWPNEGPNEKNISRQIAVTSGNYTKRQTCVDNYFQCQSVPFNAVRKGLNPLSVDAMVVLEKSAKMTINRAKDSGSDSMATSARAEAGFSVDTINRAKDSGSDLLGRGCLETPVKPPLAPDLGFIHEPTATTFTRPRSDGQPKWHKRKQNSCGEGNESNEESTTSHSLHEENQKKQKLTKKQNVSTECPGGVVAQRPSESAEVRALRFAALLLRSCDLGIQNIVHAVHQVGSKEVANRFYTNEEKARELFMKHNSIFDVGTSCVCLRDVVRKGDVKRVDDNRGGIIRDQEGLGDVYFHNTSVYIPKKADVTNELDYQIKKKECVNYIAVESTSVMKKVEGSPFSQWRAILVWPNEGPNEKNISRQIAVTSGNYTKRQTCVDNYFQCQSVPFNAVRKGLNPLSVDAMVVLEKSAKMTINRAKDSGSDSMATSARAEAGFSVDTINRAKDSGSDLLGRGCLETPVKPPLAPDLGFIHEPTATTFTRPRSAGQPKWHKRKQNSCTLL